MASMQKFDTFLGKADNAADEAVLAMASTRGSERGPLYASMAAMWSEMARLEYQLVTAERVTRRIERLWALARDSRTRIDALEVKLGMATTETMLAGIDDDEFNDDDFDYIEGPVI